MKRTKFFVPIPILLTLLLSGCVFDPSEFYFEREELSRVVQVQLVDYENPSQKEFSSWVPDHMDDLKPVDISKFTVNKTLDGGQLDDFCDKLCELPILYRYFAYDSPKGEAIRLNCSDGNFYLINSDENSYIGYIGKYSASGEVLDFYGCFVSAECTAELMKYFE